MQNSSNSIEAKKDEATKEAINLTIDRSKAKFTST